MRSRQQPCARGLTVIELMIVVLVLGVLIALAAPSVREMISAQRVRGVNAALVTDLQFARSEAARRNRDVNVRFQSNVTMSCYVAYVDAVPAAGACDCTIPLGVSPCSGGPQEIKTVQLPLVNDVALAVNSSAGPILVFSRMSGALLAGPGYTIPPSTFELDVTGSPRGKLRTRLGLAGRTDVCTPDASISGTVSC